MNRYECKAVAQERPYVSRPSRTQQLLNPKLLPKLASDVPQDLLRKNGIADEHLAKAEQERGRQREQLEYSTGSAKELNRSRSTSSRSSDSVATISTNDSGELQKRRDTQIRPDRPSPSKSYMETLEKKRRRTSSSDSSVSVDLERGRRGSDISNTRNTRRKLGQHSPLARGRRRSRTDSRSRQTSYSGSNRSSERISTKRDSKKIHPLEVHDVTGLFNSGENRRSKNKDIQEAESRQQSFRDGSNSPTRRSRRKQALSSETSKWRRGAKPNSMRNPRDGSSSGNNVGRRRYSDEDNRSGTDTRSDPYVAGRLSHDRKTNREMPRQRSLSPFSKRLALTQAMNTNR